MERLLQHIDPKVMRLLLLSSLLLLGTVMFSFMLLPEIKSHRSLLETRGQLQQIVESGSDLPGVLVEEHANVEQISHRLHGDMADLPMEQMEAYIIGRLQKISWRTGVELVSVQPTQGQTVHIFREILFGVELATKYLDFFDWLRQLNQELGFVVIKDYEMTPMDRRESDPVLKVKLTMASYRVEQ